MVGTKRRSLGRPATFQWSIARFEEGYPFPRVQALLRFDLQSLAPIDFAGRREGTRLLEQGLSHGGCWRCAAMHGATRGLRGAGQRRGSVARVSGAGQRRGLEVSDDEERLC